MSRKQAQARETLAEFVRNQLGASVIQGEVVSVDEAEFTCVVKLPTGAELPEVQLKALREAEKGVVLIPAVGATVQLLNLGEPDWLVIAAEAVSKVYMDADIEVIVNGGENGGVPVSKNIAARLNALEKDNTKLKEAIAKWTVTPQDGGAALRTALAGVIPSGPALPGTWAGDFLTETKESDLANDKFKH